MDLYLPYVLSTSLMTALFFVMVSLLNNHFVQTRHASLPMIIRLGIVVVTILLIIFYSYGNHFIQKQRQKEYGLYNVLGLEKKHIFSIILLEQCFVWVITNLISIFGGYLLGHLLFKLLNLLMKDKTAALQDYVFDGQTLGVTLALIGLINLSLLLLNAWQIYRYNPIELFNRAHAGQKEPRASIFQGVLGLVFIAVGYYLALNSEGLLKAIPTFFLAVILVMFGTYAIFSSLSIWLLKYLKSKKDYYYSSHHFLTISGMLYRMKSNAVSLASMCVLSTGIILCIGTTIGIYQGAETMIDSTISSDYQVTWDQTIPIHLPANKQAEILKKVQTQTETIERRYHITSPGVAKTVSLLVDLKKDSIVPKGFSKEASMPKYVIAQTLENYNQIEGSHLKLERGQVYFATNNQEYEQLNHIQLGQDTYQIQSFKQTFPGNILMDGFYLLFPDQEALDAFVSSFYSQAEKMGAVNPRFPIEYQFSSTYEMSQPLKEEQVAKLKAEIQELGGELMTRQDQSQAWYEINGGFLFIGGLVSIILIVGMALMLYYKQISEGIEDQKSMGIMKNLGLPDQMIKATIRQQMRWLIFGPIVLAVIHVAVAGKIVFNLMSLFGFYDSMSYIKVMLAVIVVFVILYGLFYQWISQVYYKLVNQ